MQKTGRIGRPKETKDGKKRQGKMRLKMQKRMLILHMSGIAVYGLMRKGISSPPVTVFLSRDMNQYSKDSNFWDNYPSLILQMRGRALNPGLNITSSTSLKSIVSKDLFFFFRAQFGVRAQDSALARQVSAALKQVDFPVVVLLDTISVGFLKRSNLYDGFIKNSYVMTNELPILIDKYKLPYFFRIGEGFVIDDIYIPRSEVPEMIVKYLEYQKRIGN
ncbi:MAG: hypothetical protein QM640_10570 [Niabella sp.]